VEAQPPILIVEDLDVIAFSSVEAAERYLEPWWVTENCGRIYDASGRRMDATCRGKRVFLDVTSEDKESELSSVLRAHLQAIGNPICKDSTANLSRLLAALPAR
jgi:hypothetical protein